MRPRLRYWAMLPAVAIALCFVSNTARASGEIDSLSLSAAATHPNGWRFYGLRGGAPNTYARRDLEFQWDSLYTSPATGELGLSGDDVTTLMNLGRTICDSNHNPFGASIPDMRLVYDYFRTARRRAYSTDLLETIPFVSGQDSLGTGEHSDGTSETAISTPLSECAHSDFYLVLPWAPEHAYYHYSEQPSPFVDEKEDSITGRWHSPSDYDYFHSNSVAVLGPDTRSARVDLAGTGWTRYDKRANYGFDHEFQHSLRDVLTNVHALQVDEILSTAAQALGGQVDVDTTNEVQYNLDLLYSKNYQAWRLFSAYLMYNFRGTDTTATLNGFSDDLVYRWAKAGKSFGALRDQLTNATCAECARKPYFVRNGQALDAMSRLAVLLHNWRVADYANNIALADSQYGFPPQFGFAPNHDFHPWRALVDHTGTEYELFGVIPPEITISSAQLSTQITKTSFSIGNRTTSNRLQPLGSAYWVIRGDGSVAGPDSMDLVVTVAPESLFHDFATDIGLNPSCWERDGRLVASVVGYSVPSESLATGRLWIHPDWAKVVSDPQWVDVDSVAGNVTFSLPAFGITYNTAVVVVSLADGPSQGMVGATATEGGIPTNSEVLPFRLTVGLRKAPYESVNPRTLVATSGQADDAPTWSPSGAELAFQAVLPSQSSYRQVYRVNAAGGTPSRLYAQSSSQYEPDWSPRGDQVVICQDSSVIQRDLWLCPTVSGSAHRLTTSRGVARHPALSPNGQWIAYAQMPWLSGNQLHDQCDLRVVKVDGTGDVALISPGTPDSIMSVRWSPDGGTIYFTRGDSLCSIPWTGGPIVPRTRLAPNATTVDVRAGTREVLFERHNSYRWLASCPGTPTTYDYNYYRRVTTRDTLNGDTQARFYVTGAEYWNPRWSPDGSKVAYASDQNAPGDRDLYIGQVSWNHAPQFVNAPRDTALPSVCGPFTVSFSAIDADGEALTYEGVGLPSGATLTSGGVFTWPNPSADPSDHYVVFRVLDGSGGLDHRVVRYSVTSDVSRPAAVADLAPTMGKTSATVSWTDVGDDSLSGTACYVSLRYSTASITEGNFFSADTMVVAPPGSAGNIHCAEKTSGLSSCTWYYFAVKTRDDAGHWSAISNVPSGKTRCSGSTEVACSGEGGGEGMVAEGGGGGLQNSMVLGQGGEGAAENSMLLMVQDAGAGGWALRNGMLRDATPDTLRSDRFHLRRNSAADGPVRVRLAGYQGSGLALDAVGVSYVDHSASDHLFLTEDTILRGSVGAVAEVLNENGADVTSAVSSGADVVTVPAGGVWQIDLGSELTGSQACSIDLSGSYTLGSMGVNLETAPDSWETVRYSVPRWNFDQVTFPMNGGRRARITFSSEACIRQVSRVAVAEVISPQALALTSADHSRLGSVLSAVASDGDSEAQIGPGESIVVECSQPALASGMLRDYFVSVRGKSFSGSGTTAMRAARGEDSGGHAESAPTAFALRRAEPNPFSGKTRIRFDLPTPTRVHLEVFDLQGRRIAVLADELLPQGRYSREWNGTTLSGGRAQGGIYMYRIRAGKFEDQKKMILMP